MNKDLDEEIKVRKNDKKPIHKTTITKMKTTRQVLLLIC